MNISQLPGSGRQTIAPFATAERAVAVTETLDGALAAMAGLGDDLFAIAYEWAALLRSAPRVVVVGRVNAGKSTLVNALIGAPMAETAALEATSVVTVYQDGAPSRAEAVHLSGDRTELPLHTGGPVTVDHLTDLAFVHRHLPSEALSRMTLVDTPGLATLTTANEQTTRRALEEGFEQTRAASVGADAAIFLFDSAPRADELAFIRGLGFTALNTLGVLSRADGFGEGALGERDPIEHARAHAQVMAAELHSTVATVVPVAGLLAETSHTGRLTEADARALAALAHLDDFDLMAVLETDDPATVQASLSPAARAEAGRLPGRDVLDRLLDLVGEYGLLRGRQVAVDGAHAVNTWLAEQSGVGGLKHVMITRLQEFAVLHRAGRILADLDRLAVSHPMAPQIRSAIEPFRTSAVLGDVLLHQSLRSVLEIAPDSALAPELIRVLSGATTAAQVGLRANADVGQVRAAAGERMAWVQQQMLRVNTAAEDTAVHHLTTTYAQMLNRL